MITVHLQEITKKKKTDTRLGFKCLIDSTLTINRWLSMVAACIARNRPA